MTASPATLRKDSEPTTNLSGPLTLPPDLLAEASKRLGWVGLLYAGTYTVAYFGPHLVASLHVPEHGYTRIQDLLALAAISMGLAVFFLSRRSILAPQRLLDLGLVFDVLGAFGIAVTEFWLRFDVMSVTRQFIGIPWECGWILIFPLVAPNTPRKVLVASLLAASAGPATILLTGWITGETRVTHWPLFVTYFLFSSYIFGVLAYILARIVHRYGVRLKRAREIGAYELVEKLGQGGMGEVWKATHRLLARPAAVKLIRPELLGANERSREMVVRRFEREARETAALGSTHTIDIYDFGVADDGSFYYVMELLDGISLEALVRRHGPIGAARAVYLLAQVCHSLGEAHARGLIHRDIKPANIFTCRLGPDDDFVKVLDFGLVKQSEGGMPVTQLTVEGVTAGTPSYMPPEMALARPGIDGRADIYAVGCVAYWLLTGHQVFVADSPMATVLAHVRDRPVPPAARTELPIPPALNALIMSCLEKEPSARPPTAADLAERLCASLGGDRWTTDDARAWWELHHASTSSAVADDATLTHAAATLVPRRS